MNAVAPRGATLHNRDTVYRLALAYIGVLSLSASGVAIRQVQGGRMPVVDYVKLMFDLQVVAFQADLTRVSTMMMGREERSGRIRRSACPTRTSSHTTAASRIGSNGSH